MARMDIVGSLLEGRNLPKRKVDLLERELADTPDNAETHALLVGYYFSHQLCCAGALESYQKNILALIRCGRFSDTAVGLMLDSTLLTEAEYRDIKMAWNDRLASEPENHLLLANFAGFTSLREPDEAKKLYAAALRLKPKHRGIREQSEILQKLSSNKAGGWSQDFDRSLIPVRDAQIECRGPKFNRTSQE